MPDTVLLDRDGATAIVTLNRPDKMNAISMEMFAELPETAARIASDPGIRAVVLRGAGEAFCSGIDTSVFMANPDPKALIPSLLDLPEGETSNLFQKPATAWQELQIPVIAALKGVCFGGGLQIALGADIRLGAPDLRMSVMEIKWGLIPDMGITTALHSLMRADQAKELIFTGRKVEASEAAQLGLLTRISDDPEAEAMALAHRIAGNNPDAISRAKTLVDDTWALPRAERLKREAVLQSEIMGQPNQIEAVMAAMQKRPASFT